MLINKKPPFILKNLIYSYIISNLVINSLKKFNFSHFILNRSLASLEGIIYILFFKWINSSIVVLFLQFCP